MSTDGRYLAAGLTAGLRVYDREKQWREVVRDTDYDDMIYGVTFSADGRLATTSYDGKVRLYNRAFRLVVHPQKVTGGKEPFRIAFSPDGNLLAVGYNDAPTVDLLDGHSLAPLLGPDLHDLHNGDLRIVAWSKDGRTLYAGGGYQWMDTLPVIAWADAGRGARHFLDVASNSVSGLTALPDGQILVASQNPFLELQEPDAPTHPTP